MAWINGLERKRFNEEQKRLAEQYRAAGMTEEQIEQMYQFDLVEFNSRRRFSEHTQQFSENVFEESDDDKSPLLEKYLAQLSTSLGFSFAGDRYGWVEEIEKPELIKGIKSLSKSRTQLDPNGLLTRAEMAAITNRSFGCYKAADISAYKDVAKSKWYYKDVALAVQMGTYNGVSSTSMQPDRAITRQEAIAVVARALQLNLDDYAKTDLSKFADAKEVSEWALPYMKAMVAAGYVHGRTQGLVPQANITRAEFAQLYFNIIQSYIAKSGSYTKDYKGNLLVRTKDVELKDMSIDGDLIIGCSAADGKITLSNVKISGRLVVWGGGTAAVYCNDGTTAAEVIACRVDGPVKVIFDRESTLLVYDKIKTRITERAGKFPETEIVFYAMDDLLNAQRDLNKMVDENLIQAEIPAHLYAIVGEQTVSATLKNSSKTDTYTIEIRRDSDGSLIADPITLAAGASVSSITLKEAPEYGNTACTATITATRDGKTVGTLEVKTALHAAYLWPKEVMSK